jgi:hypothetical protein
VLNMNLCRSLFLLFAPALFFPLTAAAQLDLSSLSQRDATAGLKEALSRAGQVAVQRLGVTDGYFANALVKIALPPSLARAEGLMRSVGMGRYADDLVLRMNRAAEAAVPEARAILVAAVKQMSVQDAKGILTGGDDAATRYFKGATSAQLEKRFLPIVRKAIDKVQLAEKYEEFAAHGARFGLLSAEDARLDGYVTRKAMDGLFVIMAEEEKKVRADPAKAASSIVRKVFEAARR